MLQDVLSLAREAGNKILQIYVGGELVRQDKADGSPLTAADMASHRTIIEGLKKIAPAWPILSEESTAENYEVRRYWDRFWLVDPLDGTKEFLKRNGEFTVNIALIENGNPVMGVVYAPVPDLGYFAEQGGGAFRQRGDDAPVSITAVLHEPHQKIRIVGSRCHSDARQDELLAYLGECEFLSMGSSLKLCLVAEGAAHLYPRLGPTMEWDTAAAHCVVLEAGGVVCDSSGVELHYNKPDLHNPPFAVLAAADKELREKLRLWKW